MTDVYLSEPYFDDREVQFVSHRDGSTTHLLWVVPVYTQERLSAVRRGWRRLERAFRERDADTSDLWRLPVVDAAG